MSSTNQGNSKQEPRQQAWGNIFYSFVFIIIFIVAGIVASFLSPGNDQAQVPSEAKISLPEPEVVDGKDRESGLIAEGEYILVKRICTACHSAKLITQNHLSRERWEKTIRWMQKNQRLGDLGENEAVILDYLAKYYGAVSSGRRKALERQKWYLLK